MDKINVDIKWDEIQVFKDKKLKCMALNFDAYSLVKYFITFEQKGGFDLLHSRIICLVNKISKKILKNIYYLIINSQKK